MTDVSDVRSKAFGADNAGHDTDCNCTACLIDTWHAEVDELRAEVERLREAIHAHRVARRYNPRAAWVDARLWDATGEPADAAIDITALPSKGNL